MSELSLSLSRTVMDLSAQNHELKKENARLSLELAAQAIANGRLLRKIDRLEGENQ